MNSKLLLIFILVFGVLNANAISSSGKISMLGCHMGDDTCFVALDGPDTGGTPCNGANQYRWDAGSTSGKRWYANFLTAKVLGQPVLLQTSTTCSVQNYPTFSWGYMGSQ